MQDNGARTDGHPRARSSGSFLIPIPPDDAFGLFTAEGEMLWVPGWSPDIFGPSPQQPGLVFLTGPEEQRTFWTVIQSDRQEKRHRYSRVTPSQHAGLVDVHLTAEQGGSRVHVAYDLTALPGCDATVLEPYFEPAFFAMLEEWRELILRALAEGALGPSRR